MPNRPYDLPPMTMLVAFEAAARRESFKAAAEELNVTPGAVSHQVKALEREMGCGLFDRVHRGVALTDAGKQLVQVLRDAFKDISDGVMAVRQADADKAITITATTAVSALWLTPRITRFWRQHPDIRINQMVSDTPHLINADLAIYYGPQRTSESVSLFQDELVPLASPAVADAWQVTSLADLAARPLIHLTADDQRWTTWQTWFAAQGFDGGLSRGTRVNNYMIALQAAQDGVGFVLGWKRLVRPLIANGTLAPVSGFSIPAPVGFFISHAGDDPQSRLLFDWLIQHVSDEENSSQGEKKQS